MTDKPLDDLDAVRTIIETLGKFKPEEQQRILRWVVEKNGLPQPFANLSTGGSSIIAQPTASNPSVTPQLASPSSSSAAMDIKSFIDEKKPRSDVQFAAAVAYYLRFEAPLSQRKDYIDRDGLQEACRKASRGRLQNPYQTLKNAHTLGLLDKGSEKATFVINTVGENLVAMTLPSEGKAVPKLGRVRKSDKAKKSLPIKTPRSAATKKSKSVGKV